MAFFADAVDIANCRAEYLHPADLESEDLVINGVSMYQCKICLWIVLTEMEFTRHRLNDCCVIVKSMEGHQDYKCKVCDKLHSDRLVLCTNRYFMDLFVTRKILFEKSSKPTTTINIQIIYTLYNPPPTHMHCI